jgi:hypothetical protein
MTRPTKGSAVRDLFGDQAQSQSQIERLAEALRKWDTPEDAVAAVLAALYFQYRAADIVRALKAALRQGKEGRPTKAGLDARDERLLLWYDLWTYDPNGRLPGGKPDNKGFAAAHMTELCRNGSGGQSLDAARAQLKRLLRDRKAPPGT